ncbi:hypothetical protein GCM10025868_21460 [Angustibacter aerolatus]|uniref:Uncharacterized protein n=1 Tax=Angustibacter aerolatus TaxID=1162965 RepID=A0ABQ6JH70_9ACTN|nr:hypothetical protein GCM10025868_21460 [Angustibacter aerolatus]
MWCDTVGWLRPTGPVRSQMHASPPSVAAISDSRRTRVGSPSALNERASRSAVSASSTPPVTVEQQSSRATTGSLHGGRHPPSVARIDNRLCIDQSRFDADRTREDR